MRRATKSRSIPRPTSPPDRRSAAPTSRSQRDCRRARSSSTTGTTGAFARSTRANDAGVWNEGPSFDKTFDNYPVLSESAIKNLRMRDRSDPGDDQSGDPGYQTDLPIVTWDPVPGASSYQVQVVPYDGALPEPCIWTAPSLSRWLVKTASTSWTPLAAGNLTNPPFPSNSKGVSKDAPTLNPGSAWCVRVQARSGRLTLSSPIWGDWTYLDDGTGASFTFTDYPSGGPAPPTATPNYLGSDDYVLPIRGETTGSNPLFIWNPIDGKQSYWVIVAKDPVLLDNRRLRAHPHPRIRGPDSELAAHLPGRDDVVLLGRPSRDRDDWRRSPGNVLLGAATPTSSSNRCRRAPRCPRRRRDVLAPADLPAGRPRLARSTTTCRSRPSPRSPQPAGRRDDGRRPNSPP